MRLQKIKIMNTNDVGSVPYVDMKIVNKIKKMPHISQGFLMKSLDR